ncbi:hypothetical protein PCANC_18978 [Puccinia coronata f. sp. avenae]|uniref:Integrase catalytic domain-containing protein n=1 Tax=Puccinia coronata f. sp. avenae TaxID=200324 RepID=A0A2N5ST58_9BASI|nr:hypothetical protein PCANC_18978 [Puccinia coronata f. sp. avenae]
MHCRAFTSRSRHRAEKPGQLIHSDVGSYEEVSREGYKYYATFVDDHSKYVSVFPMKSKSQVFSCFKLFRAAFEKDKRSTILSLRSDNGGKYTSNEFTKYLSEAGISHEPGPPHSPELNGVAERMNRTISNLVCCSLLNAKLPKIFWADALHHLMFTLNSIPCRTPAGFLSPDSILGQPLLDPTYLQPFGCLVWHKVPEASRKKLDVKGRSEPVLFKLPWPLPYTPGMDMPAVTPPPDGPVPVLPVDSPARRDSSPAWPSTADTPAPRDPGPAQPPPVERQAPNCPAPPPPPAAPSAPPRTSSRVKKKPDRYGSWAKGAAAGPEINTPKTWRQLLKSPTKQKWLKAADEEFSLLLGMGTWRLVPRPAKRKIIKSKWVFKVKRHADNSIQKLKARLVAMGFNQVQGVDYDEFFAPTLRQETFRLVCSILANRKWKARQVDFKSAFLNGCLTKPVYMEQPQGFKDSAHPDYVCEVHRSIYGLKQSPREWNLELHSALLSCGLTQSSFDPTLYFSLHKHKLRGTVAVHVNDLAVAGEPEFVDTLISKLSKQFTIGADQDLHHFLSLKVYRDVDGQLVYLSQAHYIDDMQQRFLGNSFVSVSTPTDANFRLLVPRKSEEPESSGLYNQLVGSLLWAAQCTRPDISFAVSKLLQFLRDPLDAHWTAALRVLNYLVSTKHLRLRLGGTLTCAGYSDSDWAEDRLDRRSTSAYTFRIGEGSISWKSRKQATVSLSSTKAEYKAMSDSCKEGVWLRNILSELCLRPKAALPLHVDNEGAEALAKNPEHHTQTKHINARYHFIRQCVKGLWLSVLHVSTKDMLADMLTKPLPRVQLEAHCGCFGLV